MQSVYLSFGKKEGKEEKKTVQEKRKKTCKNLQREQELNMTG